MKQGHYGALRSKAPTKAGLKRFFSHTENGEIETFYTEEWIRNWKEKDFDLLRLG